MSRKSSPFIYGATPALLTLLSASPGFAQSPPVEKAASQHPVEEVIVSAQKRDQRLQDVPISETVLDDELLRNANMDSGTEIARQTPNLRVSVLGDESQPKFSMRGVSTAEFNLNAISPTGVFYDEVYIGASYLGGAQIFDIERIEVLRGPQGTLFGKNTTAGAINVISKAPSFEQEGSLTVGYGTENYREIQAIGEFPIVEDRFSARLAYTGAKSDPYIKNVNPGGEDMSDIDRQAARLTLGYKQDDLDATLRLFQNKSDPQAIGAITYGTGPGGTNALGVNPRTNPNNGRPMGTDELASDRGGRIKVRGDGGYLTINKDIGELTLTSITSFLEGEFLNEADGDGTAQNLLHIDFGAKNREMGQDLRLSSNHGGPFNWIAGLYYFEDKVDVNTVYSLFQAAVTRDQRYTQYRESYAIYADGTYDFGNGYQLYGGLRYTDDKGSLEDFQVNPSIPPQGDLTYHDEEPTGRLGLQKYFTDELMVYGQFVYGYRSSAINGGALSSPDELTIADPEKLRSYEVGIKSQWLERRLTLNGAVFYYDFTDQQFQNVAGIGQQQLVNAGESSIVGLELETRYQATDKLTLSVGLGLLDTEYEELVLNGEDLSGNELIEAPEYTVNFAVDYRQPMGDAGTLTFHIDAVNVAEQHFSATNDPVYQVDEFWDAGARVAFLSSDESYEIAFYVKNLTDNDTETGLQIDPTTMTKFTTVPYPRRFGVELTVWF